MTRARLSALTAAVLAIAAGCNGKDTGDTNSGPPVTTDTAPEIIDADGDGVTPGDGDCDDDNPGIRPGVLETCNGVDDNCNNVTDEGTSDVDGDGLCDGLDTEECDGVDNDGDDRIDEDFADADGDGIADCVDGEECDGIDNNGNGQVDEGYDADGDGYVHCGDLGVADCDDSDPAVNPGATEDNGDLIDNDCDLLIDEGAFVEGDVIITEVMNNPNAVSDPLGEWFELYNASGRTLALDGLEVVDGGVDHHVLSPDEPLILEAGDYAVVGAHAISGENGRVVLDYVYEGISLGNGTDRLEVWVPVGKTGLLLDSVGWDDSGAFPDQAGASMSLEPTLSDAASNDDGGSWCLGASNWAPLSDLGTPGAANGPCASFDHDGDGMSVDDGDCDDGDGTVYLGAPEIDELVDNDCDGTAELGPIADAALGSGTSYDQCENVILDGSASYDPQGDPDLSFAWTLDSAPVGSSRTSDDIAFSNQELASFEPDQPGTYGFWLTAYDSGDAASEPAWVDIDIQARVGNNAPVADAGGALRVADSVECNGAAIGAEYLCAPCDAATVAVDGSESTDPDGDSLTYEWELLSGNATLTGADTEMAQLVITGPTPAAPGQLDTEVVYLSLTVTDCMGTSSTTDVITVSLDCTGE